jgi:pyrimidine deaminase RibD-like protein
VKTLWYHRWSNTNMGFILPTPRSLCPGPGPGALHRARTKGVRASSAAREREHAEFSPDDVNYMSRAIDLSLTPGDASSTYPNPRVGCVIVSASNTVVGEGYHPRAGLPHAEPYALRAAGQLAKGATAYVTLEPCDHYGRTAPCSQALIDAGIRRGCERPGSRSWSAAKRRAVER